MSAITELHTKIWLIQQGQFPNLINYAQTHDDRFTKEANLRIGTMTHSSPALIDFLVSSASIAGTTTLAFALKTAIDAIVQSPLRFKDKQLDITIKKQEAEEAQKAAEQKAGEDKQKIQLEMERERLEIEKQQLEVERERLETEKKRVDVALETASKMIDAIRPGIDIGTKGMLIQTLLPNLLQLGHTKGLEITLPEPHIREEKIVRPANG